MNTEKEQVISSLSSTLKEKEKERAIESLAAQIADHEEALEELSAQLREQQSTLESTRIEGIEKDQAIEALSVRMAEQLRERQSLMNRLAAEEEALQTLSTRMEEWQSSFEAEREQAMASLRVQLGEQEKKLAGLEAQLTDKDQALIGSREHIAENEKITTALAAQIAEREKAIHALSVQLATQETKLDQITSTIGWRLLSLYGPFKYRYLLPVYRMLGLPVSEFKRSDKQKTVQSLLDQLAKQTQTVQILSSMLAERGPAEEALPAQTSAQRYQFELSNAYDVICFPIIDWDFRFQRPQQLMCRFASAGHRVFYVAQTFRSSGEPYTIQQKAKNIYEVSLRGPDRNIYADLLDDQATDELFKSLDSLRRELSLGATAAFVQLPFWWPLADRARARFAWPVVYDCMDHHAGFSTNKQQMIDQEHDLLSSADLVVVSSQLLEKEARHHNSNVLLVRNGCDFEHFGRVGERQNERPVIGYYGAIADWFDSDLVAGLAEKRPDWDFLLVGSTFSGDTSRLSELHNVSLPGEKPYSEIPEWLARFDVAIIPFKRTALTEATNPVKAYEILASGKPLVSVPIPEMSSLAPLVRLASTVEEFESEITAALNENTREFAEERRAFAKENTWENRHEALTSAVRNVFPKASIIILTFNNLALNRLCVESLYQRTEWPNFEVIVVDNASSDETPRYLKEVEETLPGLCVILNDQNLGFAAGNNIGLKQATGQYLVLLNNDTVLARGWLSTLIRHLNADPGIGLIGPVTNAIGNGAQIDVGYESVDSMPEWAANYIRENDGTFAMPMVAMFCVATTRTVIDQVGLLDERFGIGMFEDDDYNRRVRDAGYDIRCAQDSFVHHWQKSSFRLLGEKNYLRVFEENRKKFEAKWGESWKAEGIRVWNRPDLGFFRDQLAAVRRRVKERKGVVIFLPSVGWGIHLFQRPHHLARAFAQQGYVSVFDCSNAHDDVNGFKEIEEALYLFRGPEKLLREIPNAVLWTFPYNFHSTHEYPKSARTIYDWIDDLEVFPYDRAFLERNHAGALREATIVTTVARRLHERALKTRPDAVYLPNGVEDWRFADDSIAAPNDEDIAEFRRAGKPIAGYYGALAKWFDYDLVDAVAGRRPDWNFLLIGPMYDDSLLGRPMLRRSNVKWIGPRDYESLPGYLRLFDVAMIPFLINDITLATSPLKLFEYFAGGKPVITTPMPECQAFPEVDVVRTVEEFSRALDVARERGRDGGHRSRLRALGRENSWTMRVQTVDGLFQRNKQEKVKTTRLPARTTAQRKPSHTNQQHFQEMLSLSGRCNICGSDTLFFYVEEALYRESLVCRECLTTSRYRSIARGILRAIQELGGVQAGSLAELNPAIENLSLKFYDTQVSFRFETSAYPIPDLLSKCKWIDMETSLYRPKEPFGIKLGTNVSNQNLEELTFPDSTFDIVITSDVMEHVRLDEVAHREIGRVLKPGGIYIFTVPHFRDRRETLVRVNPVDPSDPTKDQFLTEREYHGDANSEDNRTLSYRSYGTQLDEFLHKLGFSVEYCKQDFPNLGIMNTELFYCKLSK